MTELVQVVLQDNATHVSVQDAPQQVTIDNDVVFVVAVTEYNQVVTEDLVTSVILVSA